MTTGEKLARLRREHNYTQENLAQLLEVSRQSVSKWESDISFPETDKLIRLSRLYGCSVDYLLKNEEEAPESPVLRRPWSYERKSRKMVGGLPLWHINLGAGRTAKGIFAVGIRAKGIVSAGVLSVGVVSVGALSIGLLAIGALAAGLLAVGAVALGVAALGAIAVGLAAFGAVAVGQCAAGALAVGNYAAIGDHAIADIAIGKTKAVGSVYAHKGWHFTAQEAQTVQALLKAEMPACFGWIRGIFSLIVRFLT